MAPTKNENFGSPKYCSAGQWYWNWGEDKENENVCTHFFLIMMIHDESNENIQAKNHCQYINQHWPLLSQIRGFVSVGVWVGVWAEKFFLRNNS